ncbi:endolytic transglycosylase MltG [Alteromonas halophila]|uniref:Endolytic murein transglycosylase n=1 Tax=Alteromonas halophila TaxID=516698 RepID=A0A918JEL3_9ALTE|nr:endolytic transglycosylase MltG [Alteromonas halophila]GGW76862.1 aminodeoxychorismate lyase [Alteromonas halophila]
MRKVVALLFILALMALSAAGGIYYMQQQLTRPLNLPESTLYQVESGDSALTVLNDWSERGWLETPMLINRLWLKFFAGDTAIKTGAYMVRSDMTTPQAIARMVAGDEHQFDIGLIEGLRLSQWLTLLEAHEAIDYDIDEETLGELQSAWPLAPEQELMSVEGLFLADTYHFTYHTRASELLKRAMQSMAAYLERAWQQRAGMLPLSSPYEALILASIIEKETAVAAERPHIAGVFVNRLEQNMRLQTDPTVIYGLGEAFDGNLTRAHLKGQTPYNTYVIAGLPPTPIAMAGRAAIDAALNPMVTEDLYFVAKGDGSHKFSATLEEHNKAVYEFQVKPNQ